MPDWAWVICLFIGMSAAYWAGNALGAAEFHVPGGNAKAWLEAKRFDLECRKEIALRGIAAKHEEVMETIKAGLMEIAEDDEDDNDAEKNDSGE